MAIYMANKTGVDVWYNSTTKRVYVTGGTNIIQYARYTMTECNTTVANCRGRVFFGFPNSSFGCHMLKHSQSQGWDFVGNENRFIYPSFSVDAKVYNTYFRGLSATFIGYHYNASQPSNNANWKVYSLSDIGCSDCGNFTDYAFGTFTTILSLPPLPPSAQTITVTRSCTGGVTTNTIDIPSPLTGNTDYFSVRKSTGGTYVEVAKLYVSGGTFSYDDTTLVNGYYKVYACNSLYDNDYPSNIVEVNFNPVIEAEVIWGDYLTLTFTAQTTNWCADVDNVLWFLDGVLTGDTTGATFTSVLPNETILYELTAKYVKDGITGETSNIVELIFFYTGTSRNCYTTNTSITIPSYYNRMDYLIVGGGGAGGYGNNNILYDWSTVYGGGGGAGGVLTGTVINPIAGTYSIVIGSGGIASPATAAGDSSFYGLTAKGGGRGGNAIKTLPTSSAQYTSGTRPTNGCGAGGGGYNTMAGNNGYGGYGTAGQGYNGANGATNRGGGGGGAGGAASGGVGGKGISSSISGSLINYATGGNGTGGSAAATLYGGGGAGGAAAGGTINGGNGKQGIVCVYLYNYYPQQPIAPSGLTATLIDCDSLKLTWTNNDTTEVTGIHIQQYSGTSWVTIYNVAYTVNNYTVTGLTPSTEYKFRVTAYNTYFNSPSNEVLPTTLDAAPYNVYVSANNLEGNAVWNINDTGYGTAIYPMIRVSGDTTWITGATLAHNATSYTFTGLSFNTDYEVQIVRTSIDGTYTSDIFEFSTADFLAPVINGSLVGYDVTLQIVDTNANKEYHEIWREVDGTGYTLFDTVYYTGTTWVESGITTGHTYHYKVRSKLVTDFTPTIYSDYSNVISATIQILYAPTGLTISNVGYTGLTLTWVNNNVSGQTGNHVQRISGATWVTIEDVSSGTTTYDVSGLSPVTTYYFRIVAYNDVQEANSATAQDTTLNPAPYGLTATTITLFYQDLSWSLPTSPFGDYIVVQYRIDGSGSAWTNAGTVGYNDTTFRLSGLTMGQDYEVRVAEHDNTFGDYYSASFVLEVPAPNFPLAFCEADAYTISGSTCGNADGQIQITNQEYLLYYDFGLTDVFGNVYSLTYDLYTGLTSGYYFLSATAKNEYKWFYGYDACFESWLQINDSDTPMYLASMRVKPAQCLSFDVSYGRIWFNVSGLTSGNTYTFYAFTSDLSNVDTVTGCTGTTQFLIENAAPTCYYVMIVDEVTGCKLLIANKCVPSIENFSQGGVKRLFIMPWNSNVDYDYWSTAEEDYFLEFEDTSFFLSTKIKQYYSATGGTGYTWYSLPVFPQVCKLEQKLAKVRQGYIFTDTLTLAVNYATAAKWLKMKDVLSSENKWIFVVQDADGYWWTGGYRHGASISTYSFTSGARGEDNGYQFVISAISENKLLTALDENYVNNYILK